MKQSKITLPPKIKIFFKNKIIILILLFFFVFSVFFLIQPRTAIIYYDGEAEKAHLTIEEQDALRICMSEENNMATITMHNDNTESGVSPDDIILCPKDLADKTDFVAFSENNYDKEKIFLFDEGTGEINADSSIELFIKMPDNVPFIYDADIERPNVGSNDSSSQVNTVTISGFPKEAEIYLNIENEARIKGVSEADYIIPKLYYRVINCNKISFWSISTPDSDKESDWKLKGKVKHFEILNADDGELEFNTELETQIKHVKHVSIAANASKSDTLLCTVKNIGTYPVPIRIDGEAGSVSVAGRPCRLTVRQWIADNMTEIIMAIAAVVLATVVDLSKNSKNKES